VFAEPTPHRPGLTGRIEMKLETSKGKGLSPYGAAPAVIASLQVVSRRRQEPPTRSPRSGSGRVECSHHRGTAALRTVSVAMKKYPHSDKARTTPCPPATHRIETSPHCRLPPCSQSVYRLYAPPRRRGHGNALPSKGLHGVTRRQPVADIRAGRRMHPAGTPHGVHRPGTPPGCRGPSPSTAPSDTRRMGRPLLPHLFTNKFQTPPPARVGAVTLHVSS
jgi:hypothetical protein